jgi:hypothetical protein
MVHLLRHVLKPASVSPTLDHFHRNQWTNSPEYAAALLHWHAEQKAVFDGGPRRLLAELAELRCCRLIDMTGHKGRPRVRWQMEDFDQDRRPLLEAVHALPAIG